jgi:hypothetical protein
VEHVKLFARQAKAISKYKNTKKLSCADCYLVDYLKLLLAQRDGTRQKKSLKLVCTVDPELALLPHERFHDKTLSIFQT